LSGRGTGITSRSWIRRDAPGSFDWPRRESARNREPGGGPRRPVHKAIYDSSSLIGLTESALYAPSSPRGPEGAALRTCPPWTAAMRAYRVVVVELLVALRAPRNYGSRILRNLGGARLAGIDQPRAQTIPAPLAAPGVRHQADASARRALPRPEAAGALAGAFAPRTASEVVPPGTPARGADAVLTVRGEPKGEDVVAVAC